MSKKNYYGKNKDIILNKVREYYINNKELIKDCQKDYYEKNKDIILNKAREYYINNK